MKRNNYLLMLVISMIIFGTIGILRRQINLSSSLIVFFRSIIGALFILIITRGKIAGIQAKNFIILVISGAFLGVGWLFLFEAYNFTSVPAATLFYYVSPAIVIMLSVIVFHESFTGKKFLCLVLSLTGMILISGILDSVPALNDIKGILCALVSALLYALLVIANKFVSGIDIYTKTITQLLSSAVILLIYIIFTGEFNNMGELNFYEIALLIFVGLVNTGFVYLLYFTSLEKLEAHTVAFFSYIDPLTALILSSLILGESLTFSGLIGAALILVSSLVCEI